MESVIEQQTAEQRWESIYLRLKAQRWWPSEALVRYVARAFGLVKDLGLRALEIGCGTGRNLWFLAEQGFEVYGIDVSPTALALCDSYLTSRNVRGARLGRVDVTEGLAHGISRAFGDVSFDLIVDDRTLQHVTYAQHRSLYAELPVIARNRGTRFWTYHLGSECTDFRYGVTRFIDQCTAENVQGANALFPDHGIVCMPRSQDLVGLIESAGMKLELSEQEYRVTQNEQGTTLVAHYLTIGAIV